MRVNSNLGVQHAALDDADAGEGLCVFFSQNGDSVCRFRFIVKARIDEGLFEVGEFYSSPPLSTPARPGRLSRAIAMVVCPGARTWSVEVSAVPDTEGLIPPETADIVLASSRCCTGPVGVTRVAERYRYHSDSAAGPTQTFTVLAGMRVTGISVVGLTGGGDIDIDGGDSITVPDGTGLNLAPGASISPNGAIHFTNVDWVVEYVESA